jgi:hypothetical protein
VRVVQPGRVHQYVVQVPEIDRRHFARQDLLDLPIVGALLRVVARERCIGDSGIDGGIEIVAAIGSMGWKSFRRVGIAEYVRALVTTDPAQGVERERSFGDVGVEGSELIRSHVERNADFAKLLLQHQRHQPRGLVG